MTMKTTLSISFPNFQNSQSYFPTSTTLKVEFVLKRKKKHAVLFRVDFLVSSLQKALWHVAYVSFRAVPRS